MDFDYSAKTQGLIERVEDFMGRWIYPNEQAYEAEVDKGDRWAPTALMETLKAEARKEGLWNLFLPDSDRGAGLTNLEYAPLCERMGIVSHSVV